MSRLPTSPIKRIGDSIKASCRLLCKPLFPFLPTRVMNQLPFLGQVSVSIPGAPTIKFHTYGPCGKDRIAIKLARRGIEAYEGETINIFLALAKESNTIVDIGANTGIFALLAAAIKPNSQVLAFEPVPFIFDMLKKNIHLNKLTNLEAIPLVVSDFIGHSTFYVTHTSVGVPTDSSLSRNFRDKTDELQLPTTTLDDYVAKHLPTPIDLLKIDVETAEERVIRGALQTIEKSQPFIICEVLEGINHEYLEKTLHSLNYTFYHIRPESLIPHPHLKGSLNANQRNYVFVPRSKEHLFAQSCRDSKILIESS